MAKGLKGEVTDVARMGFTLNDNTALTYFLTHRTRLGEAFDVDGSRDVDQWYENIHVWTLRGKSRANRGADNRPKAHKWP